MLLSAGTCSAGAMDGLYPSDSATGEEALDSLLRFGLSLRRRCVGPCCGPLFGPGPRSLALPRSRFIGNHFAEAQGCKGCC